MPLDPMIANPARLDLGNPLEDYNNYLLAATRKGAMRKAKREEESLNALNEAVRLNTDASGNTNWGGVRNYLATNLQGAQVSGLLEEEGKRAKTVAEIGRTNAEKGLKEAETVKTGSETKLAEAKTVTEGQQALKIGTEAFEQAYANAVKTLDRINPDPKIGGTELVNWVLRNFDDPSMGPILRARGETPEAQIAQIKATQGDPQKFQQLLMRMATGTKDATKQTITRNDLGGHVQILATDEQSFGAPKQKVLSDQTVTPSPNTPKTTVSVSLANHAAGKGADKGAEVLMEGEAKEFLALDAMNTTIPAEVKSIDETLRVLDSGVVITGAGAETKTALMSIAKSLGIRVNDEMLKNTQMLRQRIANNLFNRLTGLKGQGVSLTPMSNQDVENLKAGGPQITDDPETLKQMFLNYRETLTNAAARYEDLANRLGRGKNMKPTMEMYSPRPAAKVPPAPGTAKKPATPKGKAVRSKFGMKESQ